MVPRRGEVEDENCPSNKLIRVEFREFLPLKDYDSGVSSISPLSERFTKGLTLERQTRNFVTVW